VRLARRLEILSCLNEEQWNEAFPAVTDLVTLSSTGCLANLRVLQLGDLEGHNNFQSYPYPSGLAECVDRLPRLRELHLNCANVDISLLFTSSVFLKLHTLRLEGVRLGDEWVTALPRVGILKSLKILQLWNAGFTDAGALALAAAPDLKSLDLLDVSFNRLTPTGIEALKKTGVNVVADYPLPPEDPVYEDDDEFELDPDDDLE
jgi:hypothetical protein